MPRIGSGLSSKHLHFYTFDLDHDAFEILEDVLPDVKVDMILLLSVCMWIEKWRELITWCTQVSDHMLFESNGTDDQKAEQLAFLQAAFANVSLLADQSVDDRIRKDRKLYFCSGKIATTKA